MLGVLETVSTGMKTHSSKYHNTLDISFEKFAAVELRAGLTTPLLSIRTSHADPGTAYLNIDKDLLPRRWDWFGVMFRFDINSWAWCRTRQTQRRLGWAARCRSWAKCYHGVNMKVVSDPLGGIVQEFGVLSPFGVAMHVILDITARSKISTRSQARFNGGCDGFTFTKACNLSYPYISTAVKSILIAGLHSKDKMYIWGRAFFKTNVPSGSAPRNLDFLISISRS